MSKKKKEVKKLFLELCERFGLPLDNPEVVKYMDKAFPEPKPKVEKHTIIIYDNLTEEDIEEFLEEPEEWLKECDMPSFSYDKGSVPEAEEGETIFVRLNGKVYSFTIHEGDCVEASWDGSIFETDIKNVTEIPEEELGKYNFVEYDMFSGR